MGMDNGGQNIDTIYLDLWIELISMPGDSLSIPTSATEPSANSKWLPTIQNGCQ